MLTIASYLSQSHVLSCIASRLYDILPALDPVSASWPKTDHKLSPVSHQRHANVPAVVVHRAVPLLTVRQFVAHSTSCWLCVVTRSGLDDGDLVVDGRCKITSSMTACLAEPRSGRRNTHDPVDVAMNVRKVLDRPIYCPTISRKSSNPYFSTRVGRRNNSLTGSRTVVRPIDAVRMS